MLRDAVAIAPRPDGDAVPNSPRRTFRFQLGVMISPFRDFRLVERQTVSNQPIPEVGTIDGTRGNGVSAAIVINGRAYDRTICDEGLNLVRSLYPTQIRDVIRSPAKLAGFRHVDAKQVEALDSERVAVGRWPVPRYHWRMPTTRRTVQPTLARSLALSAFSPGDFYTGHGTTREQKIVIVPVAQ